MIKYLYLIKRGGGTGPVKPGNLIFIKVLIPDRGEKNILNFLSLG